MSAGISVAAPMAPRLSPWWRRCAVLVATVALADWLFYDHVIGGSLALFLPALYLAVALANPRVLRRGRLLTGLAGTFLAVLPLLVQTTGLGFLIAVLGTAYAMQMLVGGEADPAVRVYRAICLPVDGSWRAFHDLVRAGVLRLRIGPAARHGQALAKWLVPVALGAVFAGLFAAANPLIESWLRAIDLSALPEHVDSFRLAFWLLLVLLLWPFLFLRLRRRVPAALRDWRAAVAPAGTTNRFLGTAAILRALVLFNLLFAVQTTLDALYLWGGARLPDGMSYAAYAHRGAYPLIVTALLAAGFVIVAMGPGSESARSPLIRRLVFLWVAQNVALVVSSMLRLDFYVEIYALTYLRVAAFVWMLLVAIGLTLIVARIVLDRSNAWLVAANLASLALTLYLCGFVNLPRLIADYNVRHSFEFSGTGTSLDFHYLILLGPQAIPALDLYIAQVGPGRARRAIEWRHDFADFHRRGTADWRAWTYEDWRLLRYLDRTLTPDAGDSR